MLALSNKWSQELAGQPETGMGYQVVSVILTNGKRFDKVVIVEGNITQLKGITGIPFTEEEIAQIIVTHDKWDFTADSEFLGKNGAPQS